MAKRNKKHKRQRSLRRKKSTNDYLQYDLNKYFSDEDYEFEIKSSPRDGVKLFFRLRFSWSDYGRWQVRTIARRSWKKYRKTQYYRNENS